MAKIKQLGQERKESDNPVAKLPPRHQKSLAKISSKAQANLKIALSVYLKDFPKLKKPEKSAQVVKISFNKQIEVKVQSSMEYILFDVKTVQCLISLSPPIQNARAQQESRLSFDDVCVIDVSRSMCGKPIELVRQTLTHLSGLVNKTDRIALVSFTQTAITHCTLTHFEREGKELFENNVAQLVASGLTNIEDVVRVAFDLIKDSINEFASVILLTDGQDSKSCINEPLAALCEEFKGRLPKKFSLLLLETETNMTLIACLHSLNDSKVNTITLNTMQISKQLSKSTWKL